MTNNTRQISTQGYPELLTVSEVARILRVDDTTVRRYLKTGSLEGIMLPRRGEKNSYRIHRETVEKLLGKSLA